MKTKIFFICIVYMMLLNIIFYGFSAASFSSEPFEKSTPVKINLPVAIDRETINQSDNQSIMPEEDENWLGATLNFFMMFSTGIQITNFLTAGAVEEAANSVGNILGDYVANFVTTTLAFFAFVASFLVFDLEVTGSTIVPGYVTWIFIILSFPAWLYIAITIVQLALKAGRIIAEAIPL